MQTRHLALAGFIGPALFAAIVVVLTAVKWDFLHDLGWSAGLFEQPDTPWPSSLALGDHGFVQVVNFLLLGASVLALGTALFRLIDVKRRIGPSLLLALGVSLAGLAIRTDHSTATGGGPDTWSGVVHAVAFTLVVPLAVASVLVLGTQFRRDERWRSLTRPSWIAGIVAFGCVIASLAGAGSLFFYFFLAIVLAWLSLVSAQALGLSRSS